MSTTLTKPKARKSSGSKLVEIYVHGPAGKAAAQSLKSSKIISRIQDGLPVDELNALQASLALPMETLATKLGISKATLHRRKAEGRLDPAESDRVVRFARLMGQAVKVFGSEAAAREWLNTPQFGLGGAVPLDYAETEVGAREVENLLGRIEYGVYS
jgi:putative toxin-antitoxin system antitoxin component (TIGR02293 family)